MWSIGAMSSRWPQRLACLIALGALPGCIERDPDPRILTGPLLVDIEFDSEQHAAVQAAVDLWSEATGGRFAPALQLAPVECGASFAIEAVHTQGCSIGQEIDLDEGRTGHVRGATDPEAHSVSVAAWLAGSGFRDTVAHELGHYLLLGHADGIMAQLADRRSEAISPTSVAEFCDVWGC
jgi:hypothetical protein